MFESGEAAKRLGIKVSSLYVYVSRGLLQSHRSPDGRRSLFAVDDVELLAASRGERRTGRRTASVTTSITQITAAGPSYRGTLASSLLGRRFEDVAELLWQSEEAPWPVLTVEVPMGLSLPDRLRATLLVAARSDPHRFDHRPEAVRASSRSMIATVVDRLIERPDGITQSGSIASRIATSMRARGDLAALTAAVDAVLVLVADHELASSTRAVRLAASTRADLADAFLAGTAVAAGPLHAGSGEAVVTFLRRCSIAGVERVIDEGIRTSGGLPGFGVAIYPAGDPRFSALRPFVEDVMSDTERDLFDRVVRSAASHDLPLPSVDLALGALVSSSGADPAFATAIFTLARMAGWTAHYLEELNEPGVRYRALGAYATR
jgi:citrate synthase